MTWRGSLDIQHIVLDAATASGSSPAGSIRAVSAVGSAPHWQCGGREFKSHTVHFFRGISSAGRASGSQSEGHGFDPRMLH